MAKLVVEINISNVPYDELKQAIKSESELWFVDEGGNKMVAIDEAYLTRALCDDSFYTFKLVAVRP